LRISIVIGIFVPSAAVAISRRTMQSLKSAFERCTSGVGCNVCIPGS
jgi:hypothetical protein